MALTKITSTNIGANAVTSTAIGYTPANKAGDTFTGNIFLTSSTTPNLYIESSNTSVNQNLWFRSNGTDTFGIEAQSNTGGAGAFLSNRSPGGGINFRTTTSGASLQTAMTIDGAGRMTLPYQPAFWVAKNNGTAATSTDIVWNDVKANRGSGYNATNGRFTAPIAGYYFFSATGINVGTTNVLIELLLMLNGSNVSSGRGYYPSSGSTVGGATVTNLVNMAAGDYVTIQPSVTTMYGSESRCAFFSGFLVG